MTDDHPLTREGHQCPLCGDAKDAGLVACWGCYRANNMRHPNIIARHLIDQFETALRMVH
jgi:hypothetical protein